MTSGDAVTPPAGEGLTPAERAGQAAGEVLAELGRAGGRGVVVDSPPGAGKSTLVAAATAALAGEGEPVMMVAQTNEQVDDLACRLAVGWPDLHVGRLSGQDYVPTGRVTRHTSVTVSTRVGDLAHCPAVVGTAAKWATIAGDARWPWAIVDEAYQMRSDALLRIAGRFGRGRSSGIRAS